MKILCIDGYNLMHRARGGFQLGDFNVVFNFVKQLRALVEAQSPSRIYFVLEGCPKARLEAMPTYKANRIVDAEAEPEKHKTLEDFHRQKRLIIELMSEHMPVTVVGHPDFEGDDVVYNLVKRSSPAIPWVIVSSDTDFIQLLDQFKHVSLYNPITKEYVQPPEFDYVTWKALRGDGSDNIPGLPGIGDKTADLLVADPVKLQKLFEDKALGEQFERNYNLIRFEEWGDKELIGMTSTWPSRDWEAVKEAFRTWGFQSLLKDKTWDKFQATFDPLWGDQV